MQCIAKSIIKIFIFLTLVASIGCAKGLTFGDYARVAGEVLTGTSEADRVLADHHSRGSSSSVSEKYFYYVLHLNDGTSTCREHDGSFDPQTLVGGYVGNARIVGVDDGYGSCSN